eukprot:2617982-Pyramimonas_sp.AAC.1
MRPLGGLLGSVFAVSNPSWATLGLSGLSGGARRSPRGLLRALWDSLGAPRPLRGALGAVWETP